MRRRLAPVAPHGIRERASAKDAADDEESITVAWTPRTDGNVSNVSRGFRDY